MKRLNLLDYGRFFAALAVVIFHYFYGGFNSGKITSISQTPELYDISKYGFFGVDFFFMISGYVIFFSAKNRSASQFLVSRLVRLYPAFWAALLLTSMVMIIWGGPHMKITLAQWLANSTMLATLFGYKFVDGVYWTLIRELYFYFAVFILLLVGMQKKLATAFLIWPYLMVLALLTEKNWLPYLGYHYYYFAAGALFAIAKEKADLKVYITLFVTYILSLYFSSQSEVHSKPIVIAIISAFYLFFLFINTPKGASLKLPQATLLGALTYPIYLIHAHIGFIFISMFATENNKYLILLVTFLLVIFIAYLINAIIEKRCHIFWKTLFDSTFGKFARFLESKLILLKNYAISRLK